jgi:two-component system nitrate/nitrite response regulator NarL
MPATVKIFIISNCSLFREGLKCILDGERYEFVAEAKSFAIAIQLLSADFPSIDLVLGDPGADLVGEFAALKAIRRQLPDVKVVILTRQLTRHYAALAHESGAVGCLSEAISAAALMQSLDLVLMGKPLMPAVAALAPVPAPQASYRNADNSAVECPMSLTGRETQILDCLVRGLPNKLIARELKMAEATVKCHLKAVLRKIDARNRTQAAIWALKSGPCRPGAGGTPQLIGEMPWSMTRSVSAS